jgi:hypothetical protein
VAGAEVVQSSPDKPKPAGLMQSSQLAHDEGVDKTQASKQKTEALILAGSTSRH